MIHDEGYSFGLGAFETMYVHNGKCIMCDRHVNRLNVALESLGIPKKLFEKDIDSVTADHRLDGRVLKVEVSKENTIFSDRPNIYSKEKRSVGFILNYSGVRRNETSPFTYIKSLQYGDCILEKRKSADKGFDEPVFLNTRGEIAEGATTNIFFTSDGRIYTPKLSCGLLPGIIRGYIIENNPVTECVIRPESLDDFDGCFVTNSVFGIMSVKSLESHVFENRETADGLYTKYVADFEL